MLLGGFVRRFVFCSIDRLFSDPQSTIATDKPLLSSYTTGGLRLMVACSTDARRVVHRSTYLGRDREAATPACFRLFFVARRKKSFCFVVIHFHIGTQGRLLLGLSTRCQVIGRSRTAESPEDVGKHQAPLASARDQKKTSGMKRMANRVIRISGFSRGHLFRFARMKKNGIQHGVVFCILHAVQKRKTIPSDSYFFGSFFFVIQHPQDDWQAYRPRLRPGGGDGSLMLRSLRRVVL